MVSGVPGEFVMNRPFIMAKLKSFLSTLGCITALGFLGGNSFGQETVPPLDLSGEKLSGGSAAPVPFEGLPPAEEREKADRAYHPYIFADLLLLRPHRQSFDFALSSNTPTGTGVNGEMQNLDYSFRAGLKAGLGLELPDKWQIELSILNFHTETQRNVTAPDGGALYATTTNLSFDEIGSAQANANLNFSVMDLDFGRWVELDPSFSFRFTGGARFAWIDQQFTALYNGGPMNAQNSSVNMPIRFSGAGITAGAEGVWNFMGKIGLYGRGKGGLISGRFSSYLTETANDGATTVLNVHDRYDGIIPTMDVGVGLCYRGEIATVRIGYDLFNYFDMVDSLQFPGPQIGNPVRRTSNISLDGVTMELGFRF